MKTTRRVLAMVLCLVLALTMATTAFAATVENRTTHSYKVYQIFKGTQAEGSTQLGDVQWGDGVDSVNLLKDIKVRNPEIYGNCATAADVAVALAGDGTTNGKKGDAEKFANFVVDYILEGKETATIAAGETSVNLPAGYYLLVDITDVDDKQDAKNPALLQVTQNGNVTIAKKYDVPINEKKINVGGTTGEADIAEYSIGDEVDFVLRVTLPMNISDYDYYKLVFHDRMTEGLTFIPGSVAVTVTEGTAAAGTDIAALTTVDPANYTVDTIDEGESCSDGKDGCTFEILFDDVKTFANNNSVITVTYKAILNEKAKINTANPNESLVEFSNNPNWKPDTDKGEDWDDAPTGVTPWDEVEVYTTEIKLTKKSGATNKVLPGAAFEISGTEANVVLTRGEMFVPYAVEEGKEAPKAYWALTDGTYTETDPATPDLDTSKYKKDASDNYIKCMKVTYQELDTQNGADSVKAEAFVDSTTGELIFSGLGVGTYTIKETVTPAGYNTIGDITLVIGFDAAKKEFTYSFTGGATGTLYDVTVLNYQGSVLPETGGMGTTLFYIFGGIMVLGAAVLLITKKRMLTAE